MAGLHRTAAEAERLRPPMRNARHSAAAVPNVHSTNELSRGSAAKGTASSSAGGG